MTYFQTTYINWSKTFSIQGWRGIKKFLMKCYEEDSQKAGEIVNALNMKDPTSRKDSRRRISIYINNEKVKDVDFIF